MNRKINLILLIILIVLETINSGIFLVFVKCEKEPIKEYDVNNIILDKGSVKK